MGVKLQWGKKKNESFGVMYSICTKKQKQKLLRIYRIDLRTSDLLKAITYISLEVTEIPLPKYKLYIHL